MMSSDDSTKRVVRAENDAPSAGPNGRLHFSEESNSKKGEGSREKQVTFDRKNLASLYEALAPGVVACLSPGAPTDLPIGTFLRGQSRVWLVGGKPSRWEQSVARELIRKEPGGSACLVCELPNAAEVCQSFAAPPQGAGVCESFTRLKDASLGCASYVPGSEPKIHAADVTKGKNACFGTRVEAIVARARGPVQCVERALKECRQCFDLGARLPLPTAGADLVTSAMGMSTFATEPYEFFVKLLSRRFGEAGLVEQQARLAPRLEKLRNTLLHVQLEGHLAELHRVVKKPRGRVYVSFEAFEQPPNHAEPSMRWDAAQILKVLGEYFLFDFELTAQCRPAHKLGTGPGTSPVAFVLAPKQGAP